MTQRNDPTRRTRTRIVVTVLSLTLLLALLVAGGLWAYRLGQAALALRADLDRIEALAAGGAEGLDPDEALAVLHDTRVDLERLTAEAGPLLTVAPYLGWVPVVGPDIAAAPTLLEIALEVTRAGEIAVEPLLPVLDRLQGAGQPDGGTLLERVTGILKEARPQLETALAHVEAAQAARGRLDPSRLNPRVRGWVERLDRYLPLIEKGLKGGLLLPRLLGADGPRVYLVLVQNEDELRATGGFISGVARVTVEGGDLRGVVFQDSYAVDDLSHPYPDPPEPLREYMLTDLWLFRDSNWSPDFPTAARAAIDLYAIGQGVVADGVIAVDQRAIRDLVDAIGPLQVAGYAEPITGQNVIQAARQAWAPGDQPLGEWWRHRKDFMAAVFEATLNRLRGGIGPEDLIRLGRAATAALERRDLLIYLTDEEAAALLAELGWDGALRDAPGDFLMVVDTNVGFNKVNGVVEASLEYTVDLTDPARPRATLVVRYRHPVTDWTPPCRQEPRYDPTYEQMMQRCYWNYLRVYAPPGAVLVAGEGRPVPAESLLSGRPTSGQVTATAGEGERSVFATLLLVQPGETVETRFEYLLPPDVVSPTDEPGEIGYSLLVQKQPGTRGIPLVVRVRPPTDATLVASNPPPAEVDGTEIVYRRTLETDAEFALRFGR